jgi:hypothetical protein
MIAENVGAPVWDDILEIPLPDGRGLIAVLRAFFDESERDESGVFCVAGCLFEPRAATAFGLEAQRVFGPYGGMHHVDLVHRNLGFKGIGDSDRDRLVVHAADMVKRHITAGVIVSCWTQDVKNFSPDWIRGFSHAYSICCHFAAVSLGGWLRDRYPSGSGGVAYIIENNEVHASEAAMFFNAAAHEPGIADFYQYRSHAFVGKADAPQLGAADFLAWEWGKYWDETVAHSKREMRRSLQAVLSDGWDFRRGRNPKYRLFHFGGDQFIRFMREVEEIGVKQLQESHDKAGIEESAVQLPDESETDE